GKALEIRRAAHKCLKRVGEAIERLSFNTAIAGIMEFVNALYAAETLQNDAERGAMGEALRVLAVGVTPIAPHVADRLAEHFGESKVLASQPWPAYDPALVVDDVIPYAVQVNGKLRAEIRVAATSTEAEVRTAAEAEDKVGQSLTGKTIRKVVF